ncbi:hypothetical protein BKA56DRAFT_569414 [Ilyonectria sp. MPI-CAGE-AT-0026]|nr:hypothetical protein BKA56DRAFT_569414 [Ilyonectria sp. MPI-CAGE-AT-0026]
MQYIDSVFCEVSRYLPSRCRQRRESAGLYISSAQDLDEASFREIAAERSVTADIDSLIQNQDQFAATFEEEANFCAGSTQIHTHSPTCVKYSLHAKKSGRRPDRCRFKFPLKLVDRTSFTDEGVLQIRRSHPLVNRWNKAMAVGLRHNHDISFIMTQSRSLALIYYLTNYTTKVEDPIWKRVAAAMEYLPVLSNAADASRDRCQGENATASAGVGADAVSNVQKGNKTRQFLMRVANRIFTERPISQVEVIAHLLNYPIEFAYNCNWVFINTTRLYWCILRRWTYLQELSGISAADDEVGETVLVEEYGRRVTLLDAYPYRGPALQRLCLYEYLMLIQVRAKGSRYRPGAQEIPLDPLWPCASEWVQLLRRPDEYGAVSLDRYLSMDFNIDKEDEEAGRHYQR